MKDDKIFEVRRLRTAQKNLKSLNYEARSSFLGMKHIFEAAFSDVCLFKLTFCSPVREATSK